MFFTITKTIEDEQRRLRNMFSKSLRKSLKRAPGVIRVALFPFYVLLFTMEMSQSARGISHSYCKKIYICIYVYAFCSQKRIKNNIMSLLKCVIVPCILIRTIIRSSFLYYIQLSILLLLLEYAFLMQEKITVQIR